MPVIQHSLMLFNQLHDIIGSPEPQLTSLFQLMRFMLRMLYINPMMLVSNKAQYRLSSRLLCLSSRRGNAGKENERKLECIGIASCLNIALLVDMRQLRHHVKTIGA